MPERSSAIRISSILRRIIQLHFDDSDQSIMTLPELICVLLQLRSPPTTDDRSGSATAALLTFFRLTGINLALGLRACAPIDCE